MSKKSGYKFIDVIFGSYFRQLIYGRTFVCDLKYLNKNDDLKNVYQVTLSKRIMRRFDFKLLL